MVEPGPSPGLPCRPPSPAQGRGQEATLCSHFVLDRAAKLGYIIRHPRPARGALARRRKTGAESGPATGLARLELAGGRSGLDPGPLKQTACDGQSGS